MVGRRVQMGQPLAVAMRREVRIQQSQQVNQTHVLHLGQQQRDVIYPLCLDRQWFIHVISLSEC